MCFPSMLDVNTFDADALVAAFAEDCAKRSLELPPTLTAEQRKSTKKAVERYPALTCESFGLGRERKLHLFKAELPVVKNTFIEVAPASSCLAADPAMVSAPAQLPSLLQRRKRNADLEAIDETAAEVHAAAGDGAANFTETGEWVWPVFRRPPGLKSPEAADASSLRIRNTFYDVDAAPSADRRAVKSMPPGVFHQCLRSEIEAACAAPRTELAAIVGLGLPLPPAPVASVLAPGSEVVIHGLVRMPAFNGQLGSVQSFDAESGRYDIVLAAPAAGHNRAKVKRENLSSVLPAPPCVPPSWCSETVGESACSSSCIGKATAAR